MTTMARERKKSKPADSKPRSGKPINVWIDPDLWTALQAYLDGQRVRPTTTSVVETAMRDFLKSEGYWPPAPAEQD